MSESKGTDLDLSAHDRQIVEYGIYDKANQKSLFEDSELAEIRTMKDVDAILEMIGAEVDDFSEYGSGFAITDKATLVGVPLKILEWRFNSGDMGGFVSFAAVTGDGRKVIVNDGSTGIRNQLETVTIQRRAKGAVFPQHGLNVPHGLTRSDYTKLLPNPQRPDELVETRATTYYLGNA